MTVGASLDVDSCLAELLSAIGDAADVLAIVEDIHGTALTDAVPARLRRDAAGHWRVAAPAEMTFAPHRPGRVFTLAFYTLTSQLIVDKPLPMVDLRPGDNLVIVIEIRP